MAQEAETRGAVERPRRVLPPAIFLFTIVLMLTLDWFAPVARIVPEGWSLLGLVTLTVGIRLNWITHDLFGRLGTTVKPFGSPSSLVTGGPFRYTRNPMYLGGVLILLGLGTLMGSLTPFLTIPVFARVMTVWFIRAEESSMARLFGEEYLEYRGRVRRWI